MNLLCDSTSQVVEGFADVWRVVVGFVRVLRSEGALNETMIIEGLSYDTYVTCSNFW